METLNVYECITIAQEQGYAMPAAAAMTEMTELRAALAEAQKALEKIGRFDYDVNIQPAAYAMQEIARAALAK